LSPNKPSQSGNGSNDVAAAPFSADAARLHEQKHMFMDGH
jgi:hypothetical protein